MSITITDPGPGVAPETMLDVINELRAAGAETMQIGSGATSVRIGVDTWVVGAPGALVVDSQTLTAPYSIVAIGDPATAAAMNIPGGAVDSVKRVGGSMSVHSPTGWTSPPCGNRNPANTLSPSNECPP